MRLIPNSKHPTRIFSGLFWIWWNIPKIKENNTMLFHFWKLKKATRNQDIMLYPTTHLVMEWFRAIKSNLIKNLTSIRDSYEFPINPEIKVVDILKLIQILKTTVKYLNSELPSIRMYPPIHPVFMENFIDFDLQTSYIAITPRLRLLLLINFHLR